MVKEKYDFKDLLEIIKILRGPNGCPWDREQNHETIKKHLIEETYEVLEAIDLKSEDKLCEELGDLLLQVVFHAQISEENNSFTINDIIDGISKKMVSRHRHVFGDIKADTSDDVLTIWEEVKKKEKGVLDHTSILKDVPKNLPALIRSYKVQQKAAQVGFDWDHIDDAWEKVKEEADELKEAQQNGDIQKIEEEMGDLLFAVVNVSRFLKVQPELALTQTINKFIKRFEYIEKNSNKNLTDMTLEEMDKLWNESKKKS